VHGTDKLPDGTQVAPWHSPMLQIWRQEARTGRAAGTQPSGFIGDDMACELHIPALCVFTRRGLLSSSGISRTREQRRVSGCPSSVANSFNSRWRVVFQARGGLLTAACTWCASWTSCWGVGQLVEQQLCDGRGKKTQLPLRDLVQQSVYNRLAGFENIDDAERHSQDPAFHFIGSKEIVEPVGGQP
jgi:hypothetical protein